MNMQTSHPGGGQSGLHDPLRRLFALRDVTIPVDGVIKAMEGKGHQLVPAVWAGATPSAQVTEDAYEVIGRTIAFWAATLFRGCRIRP